MIHQLVLFITVLHSAVAFGTTWRLIVSLLVDSCSIIGVAVVLASFVGGPILTQAR